MFCMLNPVIRGEMNGAATRFLSYRSLARPSSLDCARMDGFILICLTTNRWCAARAMSEYTPHIYIYYIKKSWISCVKVACLLHVFIWSLGQHTGRWTNGVMAPTVLASDRPLSESTDAGDPPKRVGSNEASNVFLLAMLDFGTVKQPYASSCQNKTKER